MNIMTYLKIGIPILKYGHKSNYLVIRYVHNYVTATSYIVILG